jgi:hypothetical protein
MISELLDVKYMKARDHGLIQALSQNFPGRRRKTTKTLNEGEQSLNLDLNPGPPEYEEMPTNWSRHRP